MASSPASSFGGRPAAFSPAVIAPLIPPIAAPAAAPSATAATTLPARVIMPAEELVLFRAFLLAPCLLVFRVDTALRGADFFTALFVADCLVLLFLAIAVPFGNRPEPASLREEHVAYQPNGPTPDLLERSHTDLRCRCFCADAYDTYESDARGGDGLKSPS